MAVTKGWGLKGTTFDAIKYILDLEHGEAKTFNGYHTACSYDDVSPIITGYRMKYDDQNKKNKTYAGYHFMISLAQGEGTPEECLTLAKEWIETISNGQAKYVIAVHDNTKYLHAHIVADYYLKNGKGWNIFFKHDVRKFREAADRLCVAHGFSVLEETRMRGQNYYEWMNNPKDTDRQILKKVLDEVIPKVRSYDDLKAYMERLGFKFKNPHEDAKDENVFRFTADIKLIQLQTDGTYKVRIPYQHKDFIQINPEELTWIKENKTAQIILPIDKVVSVFNKQGFYTGEKDVESLKTDFEDKTRKGHSGLRIKVPNGKKWYRTEFLSEEKDYSFEGIKEQIENNGCFTTDPHIEDFINGANSFEKVQEEKRKIFQDADIHINFKESTIYKSLKQENYFNWRSEQMARKMDQKNYNNLLQKDRENINVLKSRKEDLNDELKNCYKDLRQFDEVINEMMKDRMEDIVEASDTEVKEIEEFIRVNKIPLEQRKAELKDMISLYDQRIQNVEQMERQERERQKEKEHNMFR